MTDHEKRLVMRGMSIACGLLINTPCDHHAVIKEYQRMLAHAWAIDDNVPIQRGQFVQLVEEINEAIATKHPGALNRAGQSRRRQ